MTLEDDLFELLRIGSPTGAERALSDHLERRLREGPAAKAYTTRRVGDSLVLVPRDRSSRSAIVLAGHLDTVAQGDAPEPFRDGDRMHGRGSADMKAGLVSMIHLAEDLGPEEPAFDLSFVFYCGEEGPAETNDLPNVLDAEPSLARADLALVLEPTGGVFELGCLGSIHVEIEFRGRSCHSARPWLGRNPLRSVLPWLEQALAHPERKVTLSGVEFREVVSITRLHYGEATRNVLPGAARVNLNLRYPPDRSAEDAEAYALSLAPVGDDMRAQVVDHSVAGAVREDAPLYRHLLESTGLERRAKQAWTDVALFTARGVPALNWGPGEPALAHTRDESISIDAFTRFHEALATFLCTPFPDAAEVT